MQLLVAATVDVPADIGALTPGERRRAAAFHDPVDAADFVAAHLLARTAISRLTGAADIQLAQRCPTCGSPEHGKPYVTGLPSVTVSWSHTRGQVAAVAAYAPVGVDVETRTRRHDVPRLLRRTATPAEAAAIVAAADPALAYLRMWVAKEALVKVGALLVADFRRADVRGGRYAGFALTVSETPDVVLGVSSATHST